MKVESQNFEKPEAGEMIQPHIVKTAGLQRFANWVGFPRLWGGGLTNDKVYEFKTHVTLGNRHTVCLEIGCQGGHS
jgi:hypothetical protein